MGLAFEGPPESIEAAKALAVGDRVRFRGEGQARFKVKARNDRYVILTKPFNAQHTTIYTVIDLERGIRGTVTSWGCGFETDEEVAESMAMLERGETEISFRNNVSLRVREVKKAKPVNQGAEAA